MSNGELKRVIGFLGDRVMVSDTSHSGSGAVLRLYVNGAGNLLALTEDQARRLHSLYNQPYEPAQGPGPTGPVGPPGQASAGLNGPGPPTNQPPLSGLEYQQTT